MTTVNTSLGPLSWLWGLAEHDPSPYKGSFDFLIDLDEAQFNVSLSSLLFQTILLEPSNSLLLSTMCFGFGGFSSVIPKPPRREKYRNEEKFLRDYARYEEKYEAYMNKDNRRRRMANSSTGAVAGTSAAIGN